MGMLVLLAVLMIIFCITKMHVTQSHTTSGTYYEKIHEDSSTENFNKKQASGFGFLHEAMFSCSSMADCPTIGKLKNEKEFKQLPESEEKSKEKYEIMWKKVKSGFTDCKEAQTEGMTTDGIIEISWSNGSSFRGYCNMATDGGGWTVFQRRVNENVDFFRNWTDYVHGFGELEGSFWLGLEAIHQLTQHGDVELRIDLKNTTGMEGYAMYDHFKVLGADEKYRLKIGAYQGNIGDSLKVNNNMYFTTPDEDNDNIKIDFRNCAVQYKGPWWHNVCFRANLNNHLGSENVFFDTPKAPNATKMSWFTWGQEYGDIVYSEMKLRVKN